MKDTQITNLLDKLSDGMFKLLQKLGVFIEKKSGEKIVKGITKIVLLLIILAFVKMLFIGIGSVGYSLIYLFGSLMREAISSIWIMIVYYSYYMLALISIYNVISGMAKSKKYMIIIKKKNKKSYNLYGRIANIIKIITGVAAVPIMALLLVLFGVIGVLLCLWQKGIVVFSSFVIVISLIIMVFSCMMIVFDAIFPKGDDSYE